MLFCTNNSKRDTLVVNVGFDLSCSACHEDREACQIVSYSHLLLLITFDIGPGHNNNI